MNQIAQDLWRPDVMVANVAPGEMPPVEAGGAFPDERLEYPAAYQADMLRFAEIDPALYEGEIDPGLLARRPISVIGNTLFKALPGRGYVHTIQHFERLAPLPAGEPVAMSGAFVKFDEHPRGQILHARFEFRRQDGALALVVSPSALIAEPEKNAAATPAKPKPAESAEDRFAALAAEGWREAAAKTCTPENVVGYCGSTNNKIHLDPEYAQGFGFRAPLTAGNQMIEWHLEAVRRAPEIADRFTGAVKLMRPVFWDDPATVMTRMVDGALETAVVKTDGKIANTGRFESKA